MKFRWNLREILLETSLKEGKLVKSGEGLVFQPFRLDAANKRLWRSEKLIPLRPKPFAVLQYLVEHPGRLVTKEELYKAVWPDTYVGKSSLKGYIRGLRDMLGDDPVAPRFIETVARRGYRFIPVVLHQKTGDGELPSDSTPHGLDPNALPFSVVGREQEHQRLYHWLAKARNGERQVVFVTGEAGIGKTTLVEAFLKSVAATGNTWVERGQCVEHYGASEAYLPVLEALGRSCRRPGSERFVAILRQYAPTWLVQMPALITDAELEVVQRKVQGATRERMLREMAEALEVITANTPLIIALEDLQWSDFSTLDLLSYVAQRREAARLLLIGTYRPLDVVMKNHPLKAIKQELQLHRQCEEIPLRFLTATEVSQYLTTRFPQHRFPAALGPIIHRSTEGNPLFMVNVVEYLLARDFVREVDGHWRLQAPVEELTTAVPESLRQLIERQLERLTLEERQVLEVASVAGAEFSATAVAAGLGEPLGRTEEWCEGLVRRGQFVQANGMATLSDGTVTGCYRFSHALYQTVLYERQAAASRCRRHCRIGEVKEAACDQRTGDSAAELAVHFERGRDYGRAVQYCELAGRAALRRAAYPEAIAHLRQGLKLLQALPDTPARAQHELRLQVALGAPLQATLGYAAPDVARAYARAHELCRQAEETPELFPALWGLWAFRLVRAELETAHQLSTQLLRLAQRTHDPVCLLEAHRALGETLLWRGEVGAALTHLEQGLSLYDPHQSLTYAVLYDLNDPRVLCISRAALALCVLGYPDHALTRIAEVLALVQERSAVFSLAMARNFAALLHHLRREAQAADKQAEAARTLAAEQGFVQWTAMGTILHGWALAVQASPAVQQGVDGEGTGQIRHGLAAWQASGAVLGRPYYLALLAEASGQRGQTEEGLLMLDEALRLVDKTGERVYEAELYRLRGELILQSQGRSVGSGDRRMEAEGWFRQALELACGQHTKWWELRAAVSLSRLWQQQGKREEARQLLMEVYSWFTEGFATTDLKEAKALLDTLT